MGCRKLEEKNNEFSRLQNIKIKVKVCSNTISSLQKHIRMKLRRFMRVHRSDPRLQPGRDHDVPSNLLPPHPPPACVGLFGRRPSSGLQFGYDGTASNHHHLRFITDSLGQVGAAAPFGLHAELQKMTAQEIMDAKVLAASKNPSEAERRRRERINNHLAKLRSLLPLPKLMK